MCEKTLIKNRPTLLPKRRRAKIDVQSLKINFLVIFQNGLGSASLDLTFLLKHQFKISPMGGQN